MMKSKFSILSFILFVSLIVSCKNKSITETSAPRQLVNDTLIYNFINAVSTDSLGLGQCETFADFDMLPYFQTNSDSLSLTSLDTLLGKTDINYIFEQAEYRNFRLKPDLLKDKVVIPIDTIELFNPDKTPQEYYRNLLKKYGPICFIKLPLFSIDKQTAVVDISMGCGALCGKGGRYLYRKVNGKWILVKTLDEWIS